MPLVSVILPNYNYARFLKERVRSILGQTVRDFELVYVDDASTDESNDVIRSFADDPRLRLRLFQQNSGTVYRRWNEAAVEASGDWLWFPNADDSAHPRFLERLLALAATYPSAAIVHARAATIDAEGRLVAHKWYGAPEIMDHLEADYFAPGSAESVFLTTGCHLSSTSLLLLRRDAFEAARGFDERLWGSADWDLYLRLLHHHDIAYSAEPLAYYRRHGTNTSTSNRVFVGRLAVASCIASAYRRMKDDPRYTQATRQEVLRRAKARVFDLFEYPSLSVPPEMQGVVEGIYQTVPDRRLLRLLDPKCRPG